ncbi:FRG domain-containing protein [Paludibacter jiangxiensis]|uniref:FRG domain-containing protein n=1 Tax=Paludibacter jiangxiensis TaxID=681398 RepID=A0A161LUD2_9BACT|nr:FRG domain-containing protein [Paludibacter jiangxiensis]GAT62539.1 FRG domain-containing protein [Paludibacter jiangxiensis]
MEKIKKDDYRLLHTGFYNIYPIQNEISFATLPNESNKDISSDDLLIDDYYGRVFSSWLYNNLTPYGVGEKLNYYPTGISNEIVDTFRVPYRKIPIFKVSSLDSISPLVSEMEKANPNYQILLRGQHSHYPIDRDKDEKRHLYGSEDIKEPSFLPSHLRSNFNENFMHSMWHSQAAILLNDIGIDYSEELTPLEFQEYQKDIMAIKGGIDMNGFALGIAQHYGMPSIGLDLTKTLKVAAWFALNKMIIDNEGITKTEPIKDFKNSIIYVFRCPENSVFSYSRVRPKIFPSGRPDAQDAWFGHVGWGYAKNQLGSYLMCGFKMQPDFLNGLPKDFEKDLFPKKEYDPILNYFVKMKNRGCYESEARRALNKIYLFE